KVIVVALIGLMVVASIAAIAADQNPASGDPAYGGTYVEGVAGVPQYLNPVIAATDVDQDVARLAFSGLTRYDQAGAIVPDLASAFHTESDGRIWTFDIRDDATWHDGQPVTADDVVFTVKLLQDRGYVGPYSDAFRGVTVDRVSPLTVRFTLPDVYGPSADSTTVPLLPSHLLGNVPYAELARQPFNASPIGTGPFRVTEVAARRAREGRLPRSRRAAGDRDRDRPRTRVAARCGRAGNGRRRVRALELMGLREGRHSLHLLGRRRESWTGRGRLEGPRRRRHS